MKSFIGKTMLFFLPLLVNLRYFYVANLDFFVATVFFAFSLFFFDSSLFNNKKNKGIGLLFLIILLTSLSLLRTLDNEILSNIRLSYVLLMYSLGSVLLLYYFRNTQFILTTLFRGLLFYLTTVFIFTLANPETNLLYFFTNTIDIFAQGIDADSVEFIYTTLSNNHFAFLVSATFLFFFDRFVSNKRAVNLLIIIFLGLLLITTKARMPIISTFLFVPVIIFKKNFLLLNRWIILILPLSLIVVSNIEFILDITFLSNIFLSKDDLYTFNGRIFIWQAVLLDLQDIKIEHLYGFGGHGNLNMASMRLLLKSSGTSANLESATSHNLYLQMIADMGYLFLLTFLLFVGTLLMKIKNNINYNKVFFIVAIVIADFFMCGTSEAFWGNYYLANYLLMIVLFSYVIFFKENAIKTN